MYLFSKRLKINGTRCDSYTSIINWNFSGIIQFPQRRNRKTVIRDCFSFQDWCSAEARVFWKFGWGLISFLGGFFKLHDQQHEFGNFDLFSNSVRYGTVQLGPRDLGKRGTGPCFNFFNFSIQFFDVRLIFEFRVHKFENKFLMYGTVRTKRLG